MTNNEVLRHIRDTFNYDESKLLAIFKLTDVSLTPEQLSGWLNQNDDPAAQSCSDTQLASFLNGLIIERRGKKDGPQPTPEQTLTNNIIFKKLRIALDLKAEDIMAILTPAGVELSKHELSAFFRKPDHKHYRACKDQILLAFLKGVQL